MKIVVLKNLKEIGKTASSIISKEINKKPNLVLGLASGKTVIPIYKDLISKYKKGKINFSNIKTFNLDEYLSPRKKNSLRYFMDKNLFNKINIKKENINFLNGNEKNIDSMCKKYESKIKKLNGIDLQILGIGKNSHIGFNEPGSNFNSKTRKIKLSKAEHGYKYAVTMGIKTIMQAKKIILVASGKKKADAIARSIEGKITDKTPASFLQKHKNALYIIDRVAASKLKLQDLYSHRKADVNKI